MKKYIIIIQIIVLNNYCFAQNNLLKNKNWEIQKYYSVFDESIKDTIFSFSINNPESILNYKDLTFIFNDDNTYHTFFKNNPTVKTDEKWSFTKNKDSLIINARKYNIVKLTEDELLISLKKYYINSPLERLYPMTDFYNLKIATTLSINQNKINKKYKLFPNPVADKLFLTFESSLNATKVEIYGLDGRQLVSQAVKPNQEVQEINVQEFPKGFYFLKIKDKNDKLLDSGKILKK
jgi:Secretion system C-terminal sorting domain